MKDKEFVVLLAEDDEHDIMATRRAWKTNRMANRLCIVNDGVECLDYLYRRGAYIDPVSSPSPGIVLLDINMPRMDGLETLKAIRQSNEFKHLPVIMLTTSKAEEDRVMSYEYGANAYIVKPVGFENFSEAIRTINLFWKLVELPGGHHEYN
ncbi:MAG: response regulator [Desulfuromonadales bacterium]|nr:response regulator [Desulfuromonadales bacterium]